MKVTKEVSDVFIPVTLEIKFEIKEELQVFLVLMGRNTSLSNHMFESGTLKQVTLERVMGEIWDSL